MIKMPGARELIDARSIMYENRKGESAFGRVNMRQAPKVLMIVPKQMRKWYYPALRVIAKRIPICPT